MDYSTDGRSVFGQSPSDANPSEYKQQEATDVQ